MERKKTGYGHLFKCGQSMLHVGTKVLHGVYVGSPLKWSSSAKVRSKGSKDELCLDEIDVRGMLGIWL